MPTYQYACTVASCGHQFDAVQAFSDNALTDCPECSGRLRKVWGSIGVVFKGSGFYRNDSRSDSRDDSKKDSKNGEGKSGAKESTESTSGTKAASETSPSGKSAKSSDSSASTKSPAAKTGGDSSSSGKRSQAPAAS